MAVRGNLEPVRDGIVTGWVWDPAQPAMRLTVQLLIDGSVCCEIVANRFRPDLKQAGIGDGGHGFMARIPADLADGTDRQVEARVAGLDQSLPGSPRALNTGASAAVSRQIRKRYALSARPVFIIGSERSGTTILAQALRDGTGYTGYNEGHIFPLLARLRDETAKYYQQRKDAAAMPGTLIGNVPEAVVRDGLAELFSLIAHASYGSDLWFDKTPGLPPILAAPAMLDVWPQAKVIFARRRGIENIASRLKKFPQLSFERHCRDWAACMLGWREVQPLLGDRSLEIDQYDIDTDPRSVAARIAAFLEFGAAEAEAMARIFASEKPEWTRLPGAKAAPALAEMPWSEDQRALFRKHCGRAMQVYGYTEDEAYRTGPG